MNAIPHLSPTMASRKLQALAFIEGYIRERKQAPSLAEIAAALEISRKRVLELARKLDRDGLIIYRAGVHRGILLPDNQAMALRELEAAGWKINRTTMELRFQPVTNSGLTLPPELDYFPDVEIGDDRHGKN